METAKTRLRPDVTREPAAFLAIRRDRDEIPVVDRGRWFAGAGTSKAIVDTILREHFEDALLDAGVRKTEHVFGI